MPKMSINDCRLYYEFSGEGRQTVMFSHGLLLSTRLFDAQVEALQGQYRILNYDHRGQGQSEDSNHTIDMDLLYEDAVALIEQMNVGPVHFVGLSMGGFVGMRLAARRPDLVKSLTLIATSAEAEKAKFKYTILNTLVKLFGVKAVTKSVMPIMFGQSFLTDPIRNNERLHWQSRLAANKKHITKSTDAVIFRAPVLSELPKIQCPTLILVGDEDVATPLARAQEIAAKLPQSELKIIQHAGHSTVIEQPEQCNQAIQEFLEKHFPLTNDVPKAAGT